MAGHPRNIKSIEHMIELFDGYTKSIVPRFKVEYVGKDGERVETPLKTPLTFEGFKDYCYDVVGTVEQYFVNQDNLYTEYISICTHIKNKIRRDQIEGGMVGQYNPSITQRLNNLKETIDTTVTNVPILNVDFLDDSKDNITSKDS